MQTPRDWQLTRRYRCPQCNKRYAVVEWKQDPKCRQCDTALLAETSEDKPITEGRAERDSPSPEGSKMGGSA